MQKRSKLNNIDAVGIALSDPNILSRIFAFFNWKDILRSRVSRIWRQAARITVVPKSINNVCHIPDLYVNNREFALALDWLSKELPMISSITVCFNVYTTKAFEIATGDNPKLPLAKSASIDPPVNLCSISNFRSLKHLSINRASFNGSYSYIFDFPELRTLELVDVGRLVWDLTMLQGLPQLEQLIAVRNTHLTGSLSNVQILRKSLMKLSLTSCHQVQGDLMDLRDFPKLKEIGLTDCTSIVGDIRNVRVGDFPSVASFGKLPESVIGGSNLPYIADAASIMNAWYILKKKNPLILSSSSVNGLSRLSLPIWSTERYINSVHHTRFMPTCVEFVTAGPRIGWRWTNAVRGGSCEAIWLDPAPNPLEEGYDDYVRELRDVNRDVCFYKGFFGPPSKEEHLLRNEDIPYEPLQ